MMPPADAEALSTIPEFDFMRALDLATSYTPLVLFADFPVEKRQSDNRRVPMHAMLDVRSFFIVNEAGHFLTLPTYDSR